MGARELVGRVLARDAVAAALEGAAGLGACLEAEVQRLCEIPAPSFHEAERGRYLVRRFSAIGLRGVEMDATGNVIGCLGAPDSSRAVLLAAHMDTVFPPETEIKVRREGDRLCAPGVGDNAATLGIMLEGLRALIEGGLIGERENVEVLAAATVGEEGLGNLRGMKALVERFGPRLAAVVALDGLLGHVVAQAVGSVRLRVSVRGPGGHSWSDFGRPSAIHHLAHVASRLARMKLPAAPPASYNIGRFAGGTSVNTIAAHAQLELDLRAVDAVVLKSLVAQVEAHLRAEPIPAELECRIEEIGERPAGSAEAQARCQPLVELALEVWRALGLPARKTAISTDANVAIQKHIPATAVGLYRGGGAHTLDEWLAPSSLPTGLRAFLLTVLALVEQVKEEAW